MEESRISTSRRIRSTLEKGGCYTSTQLNTIAGTQDSRKRISELRAQGVVIRDSWIVGAHGERRKVYYIPEEYNLTLYDRGYDWDIELDSRIPCQLADLIKEAVKKFNKTI